MTDDKLLKEFNDLVDALNETQGTNAKIELLKGHDGLRPLVRRIWDDTKTHVTKKGLETWRTKKIEDGGNSLDTYLDTAKVPATLYDLYDQLAEGSLSGDAGKSAVWQYIAQHPKYEDLVLRIMEKNPRIRLGSTLLLKAFPGVFSQFKVCLAKEWTEDDFEKAYAAAGEKAWISDKIDGMRLITKITANSAYDAKKAKAAEEKGTKYSVPVALVEFFSRKGHPVTSLEKLRLDILEHIVYEMTDEEIAAGQVLDGEVVALDPHGREDFKLTVSEARKKDVTMANPRYKIFDLMPLAVFEEREAGDRFSVRLENLRDIMQDAKPRQCELLPQTPYTEAAFKQMQARARKIGSEGLMIRMDAKYEARRTRNLLKWKIMGQDEYRVDDIIVESMPFPNKRGGEDMIEAVSALVIKHKGNRVQVGSGLDKAERIEWAAHPELIKGKMITVKFQEEFTDAKTGKMSLRCPIYMGIVGDREREV